MAQAAGSAVPGDRWLPPFLQGARLQLLNLVLFYAVVLATVDYPNATRLEVAGRFLEVPLAVGASALLAGILDSAAGRLRNGAWSAPHGAVIATLGAWLVLDGFGWLPFILLPMIVVAIRHVLRTGAVQWLNANNAAMCVLILAGWVRVGVNDWGAAPQTVALMVLFGTIATVRVGRWDTALLYLAASFGVHSAVALWHGYTMETAWLWALSPLQVMLAFFAVTDPATSPRRPLAAKAAFVLLVVLLSVPATLAGRVEAPIFALLVVAPQRRLVERGVAWVQGRRTARPVAAGGAA